MAIAMRVVGGWRGGDMGGAMMSKKRSWGDDQQKLFDLMVGASNNDHGNTATHTLDLLGGGGSSSRLQSEFVELDTEMPLPSGWEKRLDLKSGAVYFVNWTTGRSTTSDPRTPALQEAVSSISHEFLSSKNSELIKQQQQQQRFSPEVVGDDDSCKPRHSLPKQQEHQNLELNLKLCISDKLDSSVCTMEKVHHALARSQKQARPHALLDKTAVSVSPSPATSTSSSSSSALSIKRARIKARNDPPPRERKSILKGTDPFQQSEEASSVTLTVCKNCFMYVMLSASDPRCPRCSSPVILDFPLSAENKDQLDLIL